jgi:hypothetical protein
MTTLINDPILAERLTSLLQAKGYTAVPADQYAVSFFGNSDKCDPLNTLAILSADAMVNGVKCGWSGETSTVNVRGVTHDEITERLLAGLADEIDAKPNQRIEVGAKGPRPVV